MVEAELEDDGGSLGEFTEVVKLLHSSKAPWGWWDLSRNTEGFGCWGAALADTSHQHCVEVWGSAKGVADRAGGSPV